jgi:hypothetical protein
MPSQGRRRLQSTATIEAGGAERGSGVLLTHPANAAATIAANASPLRAKTLINLPCRASAGLGKPIALVEITAASRDFPPGF